jgi:hypothetical protein
MGRTEFLTPTINSEPEGWKAQTIHESEMALFYECMLKCVHMGLDTADVVRDGDLSPIGFPESPRSFDLIESLGTAHCS